MGDGSADLPDEELVHLAQFLESDAAGAQALDIAQLDGFLTALAVGPRRVPLEHCWPHIWGEKPHFADAAERLRLENAVRQRYREVRERLARVPESWAPIFYETEEGEIQADGWCGGFILGMQITRDAWLPLFEEEEGLLLILPVLLVASDGELGVELEVDPEDVETILEQAPELVPSCVIGIHNFFAQRASAHPGSVNGAVH